MHAEPGLAQTEARQQVADRLARAAAPRMPRLPHRHRFPRRRTDDRVDN
jgi:hypothetical protein